MKGLILSVAVFTCYVVSTAAACHILRPRRHALLFFPAALAWAPVYYISYVLTPADLGFLPRAWTANLPAVDLLYGLVVYFLNAHSYIDFFFAFNGGFSMSLMLELLQAGEKGLSTEEIISGYRLPDGGDKIYGWRLPRLEETGYITIDPQTNVCRLTAKGRVVAALTRILKRFLNLGRGG